MSFDDAAVRTLFDQVVSHAASLGIFERVNSHEPKNAPGSGLSCSVWAGPIGPIARASGLASTSGRVVFNIRVYSSMLAEPQDDIDREILTATSVLMGAYSGDFTLGGNARAIDLLGMYGTPLSADPGYINHDGKLFRVMEITLPVIVNDMWSQTATAFPAGFPVTTGYLQLLLPSGDTTGATDTANLNAAVATAGRSVYLGSGTFFLLTPVLMSQPDVSLIGSGLGNTARQGATVLQPVAGFTGTAVVQVTAPACQVSELCILGPTATATANPVCNGIEITGAKFCNIQDLFFQYLNGWCIESLGTAGTPNIGTTLYNLTGYNSAGGVHVQGVTGSAFQAQHSLSDLQFSQIGVATGPNANLDAIFLEDCQDILTENTNCAVSSSSTGATLHIKGACATMMFSNTDIGVFPTAGTVNPVIKIEDSANGSPTQVTFVNGVAQAGQRGLLISGGANQVTFENMWFKNNLTDGAQLSGTGFQIDFRGCNFGLNGQGATGTQYDLNNSGTATGKVRGCYFQSPVVAVNSTGVQNPVNIGTSGTALSFADSDFIGTGTTVGNCFTALPSVVRNCRNYNPHGAQTVAVPLSGVAPSALHYDAVFYITPGAGGLTVVRNTNGQGGGGGPSVAGQAGNLMTVYVPANTNFTPTYTNAPTWVVDGL